MLIKLSSLCNLTKRNKVVWKDLENTLKSSWCCALMVHSSSNVTFRVRFIIHPGERTTIWEWHWCFFLFFFFTWASLVRFSGRTMSCTVSGWEDWSPAAGEKGGSGTGLALKSYEAQPFLSFSQVLIHLHHTVWLMRVHWIPHKRPVDSGGVHYEKMEKETSI